MYFYFYRSKWSLYTFFRVNVFYIFFYNSFLYFYASYVFIIKKLIILIIEIVQERRLQSLQFRK